MKRKANLLLIGMAEEWGNQAFAARRHHEDTTRGSAFVYTNSNHTRGNILAYVFIVHGHYRKCYSSLEVDIDETVTGKCQIFMPRH